MILATRASSNSVSFAKGVQQIITDEAAHFMQLDMIIVAHGQ